MKIQKLLMAGATAAAVSVASLQAQVIIFSDNFDSYADQAAFNAVWAGANSLTLSTGQAASSPQSALAPGNATAYMNTHDFTPTAGSDAVPLSWSFSFYDSTQAANLRQFASIRDNAPSLAQLVAFGAYNDTTLTKDRYDLNRALTAADLNTYYAVRVAFGPAPGWFILNGPGAPTRSTGWHELKAVFYDTRVEFFIDGVNALSGLNIEYAATPGAITFDRVTIGSGLSSANGLAYYDNVMVLVPEPSSLGMILMGGLGLGMMWRLRRR